MEKNTTSDMREFLGTFPTNSAMEYENLIWGTETSYLVVSVDHTQNGEWNYSNAKSSLHFDQCMVKTNQHVLSRCKCEVQLEQVEKL